MATWKFGIILPTDDVYESSDFTCDDDDYTFSLSGAKGDGVDMLCYGNCRAGTLTSV